MRGLRIRLSLLLVVNLLALAPSFAQFKVRDTENMRLIYLGETQEYLVPYVAQTFENALQFHSELYDYTPSEPVTVLMHDFDDYGNAGADAVPTNYIMLSIAPYNFAYETVPANERMNSTFNHELVHIVANDMATRTDEFFRTLFAGKVSVDADNPETMLYTYLSAPRRYSPRWYHEGIAVFMETWMAGGLGRALGAYDEMVFRTLHLEDGHLYDVVGLESEGTQVDFQVGVNSYLYGTRFMSYLAYQYGPEKLIEWSGRSQGSKAYFGAQFRHVYGLSLSEAWDQWLDWERQFQQSNLEAIRQNPTTEYRPVTGQALGSMSRAFFDEDEHAVFAGVNFPGAVPHITRLDLADGRRDHIADIKGSALFWVTSLAYDTENDLLFYTADNNRWRDLVSLDLQTGEQRILLKDVRVGDLAFNPADRSLWGVRHVAGFSTIVRIPYPYRQWYQVLTWDYGTDSYDLDISHDGEWLAAALAKIDGNQTLIRMSVDSLLAGSDTYDPLFDFQTSNPGSFTFSPDDRFLYGSSYYSGVSNIFRYDLQERSMQILTNAETGFFRPSKISKDSLLVFRYSKDGFQPVLIADEPVSRVGAIRFLGNDIVDAHPVVRDWLVGSPALIKVDSLTTYHGVYRPVNNLSLASAYPIVEGYKDYAALGYRLNLSTPIGLHNVDLSASYTPHGGLDSDERIHGRARYRSGRWSATATINDADFYDLFGPTKTSRKGYSLGLSYRRTIINDRPKRLMYTVGLNGYAGLDRLPNYQNITTPSDKSASASFLIHYENLRSSIGAVDKEKGVQWQFGSRANLVRDKIFPRIYGTLDLGVPGFLPNDSYWLRTAAGLSPAERGEPYANFYFGGFGNNWVDHRKVERYRLFYTLPGAELNQIAGTNFVRVLAEYNLPPLRFRNVGGTRLFLNWIRPTVFAAGLVTNVDDTDFRREWTTVGAQLDIRIVAFSYMPFTLSAGYGTAFPCTIIDDPGNASCGGAETEFMVSLKVL